MAIFGSAKIEAAAEPKPAKPKDSSPPGGLSIIAAGMTVRGDLESNGTVKVEGAVEGHLVVRGQVLIAKGGLVHGDVEAREAIVGGMIQGSVRAEERVEVQAGASVEGDITTLRIAVAEGGRIDGRIHMGEDALDSRPARTGQVAPPAPGVARASTPLARVAVPPRSGASY